jgi:hypothetical protein
MVLADAPEPIVDRARPSAARPTATETIPRGLCVILLTAAASVTSLSLVSCLQVPDDQRRGRSSHPTVD